MSQSEHAKFDPQGEVTFDLPFGQVHIDGAPSRVMVPADALIALCESAGPQQVAELGRSIGDAIGRRMRQRLGGAAGEVDAKQQAVRSAPFEQVIEHLAGEVALIGLGSVSAERWGRALVLVVERSPLTPADGGDDMVGDSLLGDVLAAAMAAATGAQAQAVRLAREGDKVRFAILSPSSAGGVRSRIAAGHGWGDLLAKLHAPKGGVQ